MSDLEIVHVSEPDVKGIAVSQIRHRPQGRGLATDLGGGSGVEKEYTCPFFCRGAICAAAGAADIPI